ncbi:hypothetical protein Q5424_10840, partial [Conexibacter sp. JD483]
MVRAVMVAWVALLVVCSSAGAVVEQPFAIRYTTNDTGATWVTGNTLMTCPAAEPACAGAQAGTATGAALNNNGYAMTYVDVDGDPTTFDSSTASFAPPADAQVLFAGLYWGGRVTAGTRGAVAPAAGARGAVLLRTPASGGYVPVSGSVADSAAVPGAYGGFADVTAQVVAGGAGQYTVANVQAGTGLDRYAGWGLVIVYRSATQPLRNLTVFDGLATIQQGDPPLALTVSGFVTPRTGAVRTAVGLVAYEGDRGSAGDRGLLGGQPLTDAANPANNLFNSSISFEGVDSVATRTPGYVNQLGFDADRIVTTGLIANGATSATLELSTTLDQYLTQMVSLATDLSAPALAASKTVANVTTGGDGSVAAPGDLLRYSVTVTNNGDDVAEDVVVSDPAPAGTAAAGASSVPLGALAPGAAATAVFEVRVGQVADGFAIVNSASASGVGVVARQPVAASSNAVRTVVRVPVLTPVPPAVEEPPLAIVTPSIAPSRPVAGEPAVVAFSVRNTTAAAIEDVSVVVSVPGAQVLGATIAGGRCGAPRGSTVRCTVGSLAPGAAARVRVRVNGLRAGAQVRPAVTVR